MITAALSFIGGNWMRLAIYGLVIVGALGTAAGWGYHRGVKQLWDYQVEQAKAAVAIVVKQGVVTERIITEYVEVAGKTEFVTHYVQKEVEVYVQSHADNYVLDAGWRHLHDDAALNAVPGTSEAADAEGGAPTTAATIKTVTANYAACHRTADTLASLQAWVRGQRAASIQ